MIGGEEVKKPSAESLLIASLNLKAAITVHDQPEETREMQTHGHTLPVIGNES